MGSFAQLHVTITLLSRSLFLKCRGREARVNSDALLEASTQIQHLGQTCRLQLISVVLPPPPPPPPPPQRKTKPLPRTQVTTPQRGSPTVSLSYGSAEVAGRHAWRAAGLSPQNFRLVSTQPLFFLT